MVESASNRLDAGSLELFREPLRRRRELPFGQRIAGALPRGAVAPAMTLAPGAFWRTAAETQLSIFTYTCTP